MPAAATPVGSPVLWYVTRASGLVTLLLLSTVVVLGLLTAGRRAPARAPRFVTGELHRSLSLVSVAFLVLHVATTVVDGYAPIGWLDTVVPFHSPYRTLWLGLGTVACDLLLALVVTSLLRVRLGLRAWRLVHWLAYVCWPVAILHGLGTGTDTRSPVMLVAVAACLVAVLAAGLVRVSGTARGRVAVVAGLAAVALAVWTATGPLQPGWAHRAGSPTTLAGTDVAGSTSAAALTLPVRAAVSGSVTAPTSGSGPGGRAEVDISLTGSDRAGTPIAARVRLLGSPASGGGIVLSSGTATLGPRQDPGWSSGPVVSLAGDRVQAALRTRDGRTVVMRIVLRIDGSRTTGILTARPGSAGGGTGDGTAGTGGRGAQSEEAQ